jgi:bile acid:Na+ symporter, BASS family
MDLLQLLLKASVVVFVVSSMLSIGLAAHGGEIVAPLRRPAWVLRALIANFVLAPAVALLMAAVLPLEPGYELGLLLLGFAAGAPFLPMVAAIGRTNVPTATALMVLLMAGSVVAVPLALPLFVKGLEVDPWGIAAPLVVLMLAPLLLGMAGQRFAPRAGARLLPVVTKLSNISFVAAVVLICGTNVSALSDAFVSGAVGAAILFVVLLFAGGWAVAEPDPAGRRLLGYATAGRNIGAALVGAGASTADPTAIVMVIVTGVVGVLLLLAAATWSQRRDRQTGVTA